MPLRPSLYDAPNPELLWKTPPFAPEDRQWTHVPDYFTLLQSVGHDGRNERSDVIKAQTLLANAGYYDLAGTGGPTGWYGKPLELSLRKFQQDRGLTVDGVMLPGGETLAALEVETGSRLNGYQAPTPKQIDDHHNRLARGQSGLFMAAATSDRPAGVTVESRQSGPPSLMGLTVTSASQKEAHTALDEKTSSGKAQVAAAQSLLLPVIGAGAAAVAGAIGQSSKDKPQGSTGQPRDKQTGQTPERNAFDAMNRAYLGEGIRHAFGDRLEARGNANTRKSNDALIRACEEVIGERVNPFGHGVEHVAGGTKKGDGDETLPERGILDKMFKKGGSGSSFPDVLFRSKDGYLIPFNTVTMDANGNPVPREENSWGRLLANIGHKVAGWIGKKRDDESDDEYFQKAKDKCEEVFDAYLDAMAKGKPLAGGLDAEKPPE